MSPRKVEVNICKGFKLFMNEDNKELLISQKEAASILGLKTTKQINLMIKEGILNTYEKK